MHKVICVYSSSSSKIDSVYFKIASCLGEEIAKRGDTLLFGGGLQGLMGATAVAAQAHRGHVIGVIPKALNLKNIVFETCDELIVTEDMRTRKSVMDAKSDAFIALPGGYGTLEELLEIITLKQLRYHDKPIVILNINDFYRQLLMQFQSVIEQRFAAEESQELYFISDSVSAALSYIDNYRPKPDRLPKYVLPADRT